MVEYKVNLEDKQVRLKMGKLVSKTPQLSRRILGLLGEAIVARTNTHYLSGQVLRRRTGTLAKSVNYRHNNDWSISVGSNVAYAAIHEFGGEIYPKTANMLSFPTENGWVMTSKVVMPKRPWLSPSVNDILFTDKGQRIIDDTVDSWIKRDWRETW